MHTYLEVNGRALLVSRQQFAQLVPAHVRQNLAVKIYVVYWVGNSCSEKSNSKEGYEKLSFKTEIYNKKV